MLGTVSGIAAFVVILVVAVVIAFYITRMLGGDW